MELDELLSTVQKIEILDRSIYKQKLSGAYNSQLKGQGLTFDSIRKYEAGDDVRDINWNVTARFQEPYINTYIEDKKRLIWIIIDVSGSTIFGTDRRSKLDLEIEIGATLAYSSIKKNDLVGVIFFSDKIEKLIQPARGMQNFLHIAKEMVSIKPGEKKTDIGNALQFFSRVNNKRSLIFLLSDFIGDNYAPYLKILEQKHELIAIKVYDKREQNLPDVGWIKLRDLESGKESWVNTAAIKFKKNLSTQFEKSEKFFDETFHYNQMNTLKIGTNENIEEKLLKFMGSR